MADVFDVAKYILSKQKSVSTFKLQKLVYYSQAWSLVWDERPLFANKIFAWANGPVCEDLYQLHKGSFLIVKDDLSRGEPEKLTPEEKETIDVILTNYGKFSGQQLSNLTHKETPWINARKGLEPGERGQTEITLEDMADYYSGLLATQQAKED